MRTMLGKYALSLLVLAGGFGAEGSIAQTYPAKPIRILTAGAGGGSDVVARLVTPELGEALGQPIVIENRPAGVVLTVAAAKAAPDGYTLTVNGATVWVAPLLREAPYDPIRDFATITVLSRTPNLLVITPSLPVKTMADLIKLAKSKPGALNASTGSDGSSGHLAAALLNSLAGINIVRIPYKEQARETADLISGQTHISFGAGSYAPLVRAGKIRLLGTGGTKRALLFPDVPTIAETLPGYISEVVNGFWAPAKTPEAVVRRLSQEAVRVLERPEVRDRLLKAGVEPGGGSPEEFADYIKSDVARMSKILKAPGSKPDGA